MERRQTLSNEALVNNNNKPLKSLLWTFHIYALNDVNIYLLLCFRKAKRTLEVLLKVFFGTTKCWVIYLVDMTLNQKV